MPMQKVLATDFPDCSASILFIKGKPQAEASCFVACQKGIGINPSQLLPSSAREVKVVPTESRRSELRRLLISLLFFC
jgi:hypothetical protein